MDKTLKVLLSSESQEWYTPPEYAEAARRVMGSIDLDPASCEAANQLIRASEYYTKADNGLERAWYGNVFVNPPYGKLNNESSQGVWVRKGIAEYRAGNAEQIIFLVNFVPGYLWFAPLWQFPICSVQECISFYRPDGTKAGKAKQSSCFVYMGPDEAAFVAEFNRFGPVVKAVNLAA